LINLNKIEKLFFAVTRAIEIIGEAVRIFLNPLEASIQMFHGEL